MIVRSLIAMDRAPVGLGRERLALDKGSVRTIDVDGRMRVALNPISKATVNGYYGREIPHYEELGLDPERMYQLLRPPEELEKAADTFNGIPIVIVHRPQTAADHETRITCGTTGTDAVFEAPYLKNTLFVWTAEAIGLVESEEQRELSCGYRYRADMTPGEFEGVAYDGRMLDIVGNHVALVDEGRAGPDVIVQDRKPESLTMKKKLSKRALVVRTAIATVLAPLMAQDQKIDLGEIKELQDLKSYNFDQMAPKVVAAVQVAAKGKLAQDADLAGLAKAVDAFKGDEESEETREQEAERMKREGGESAMDAFEEFAKKYGRDGMSEDEKAEMRKAFDSMRGAKDEEGGEEKVTKGAMDAAIRASTANTEKRVREEMRALRIAEIEVRPLVGEIKTAMDSAAAVYRYALEQNQTDLTGVPEAAYGALVRQLVKTAADRAVPVRREGAPKNFAEQFPEVARVGVA